jgi:hypothetical protein
VTRLTIEQDPTTAAMGSAPAKNGTADLLGFSVARQANGNTLLTVQFDEPSPAKGTPGKASTASKGGMPPGMEDIVKQMFDGFRIAIDVEVDGPIVATSSPFVRGSRVTVLEMDLGMLLADQANLKTLERIGPGASVSEMIPLLKDIKGIKVNESPLTIEFAGR